MGTETNTIEHKKTDAENSLETRTKIKKEENAKAEENCEIQWGVRSLLMSPLSACEKLDKMFGSGGEAIVHHMWFESGQSLFDSMIKFNADKSPEELLRFLINAQPRGGWGNLSVKIIRSNPPLVDITVKNPPVKTLKGSQKYLIGSFWAGVLSRYFNRQLTCKNFGYNPEKDEFSFSVTV